MFSCSEVVKIILITISLLFKANVSIGFVLTKSVPNPTQEPFHSVPNKEYWYE